MTRKHEPVMPSNWDPPEHERVYYYHRQTGDLGYLVRREGTDYIRLDRPSQEICRPFRPEEWNPKLDYRPMTTAQIAQIAFEADKKLCYALGKHDLARREWLNQKDEERIAWIKGGPVCKASDPRKQLFLAIMAALHPHARGL